MTHESTAANTPQWVSLREVTRENFRAILRLAVAPDQQTFVATNAASIAQAHFYPHFVPTAIYEGNTPVGFAMYGRDPETGRWWLARLMIAADRQRRGLGRAAMRALLERFGSFPDCDALFLSFEPDNAVAERLYLSLGFRATGEVDEDGEIVLRRAVR